MIARGTVEKIVSLACRAPSADNSQPFSFRAHRVGDAVELRIFHDAARARHRLNIGDAVSRLTLGFLAESLALAAGAHGLKATLDLPDWSAAGPQLVMTLADGGSDEDPLATCLSTRCTDRRAFEPVSMPPELVAALEGDAGLPKRTRVVAVDLPNRHLEAALIDADSLIWSTPGAFGDALRWVRPDRDPPHDDGMPRATLGTSLLEGTAIAALVAQPKLADAFPATTMRIAGRRTLKRQLAATATFVAVWAENPGPAALVDAGRAGLRAWLRLDAAGWAVQPMSLAPLAAWYGARGELPAGLSGRIRRRLTGVARGLQSAYGARDDELPLWLMRTGPRPATARLASGFLSALPSGRFEKLLEQWYNGGGSNVSLGDLTTDVALVTLCMGGDEKFGARTYTNLARHAKDPGDDPTLSMSAIEAAMRTSAFPVFLPMRSGHIDGSAYANNPAMCAIAELLAESRDDRREGLEERSLDDIVMLSMGVSDRELGSTVDQLLYRLKSAPIGWIPWLLEPFSPLLLMDAMIVGADSGVAFQCKQLLRERFLRVATAVPTGMIGEFLDVMFGFERTADRKATTAAVNWEHGSTEGEGASWDQTRAFIVDGCGAIVSCLGHNLSFKGIYGHPRRLVTDAVRRLCDAVHRRRAKQASESSPDKVRFVLMNTAGNQNRDLDEPITTAEKLLIGLLRVALPPHPDNEQAADHLRVQVGRDDSAIEWVVVRPDTLVDDDAVTPWQAHPSPTRSPLFNPGKTSRINVAAFMTELLADNALWRTWQGRMPVLYNA